MKGAGLAKTPSERQRKLVEEGAKGVADRWLGDPEQAARDGVKMRSAVKRFSGKEQPDKPPEPASARTRKRSARAEQAAAGMMGPPPATFDEKAIRDWLAKMPAEDLAKLARLTAIAKAGRREGRAALNKVDRGIAQRNPEAAGRMSRTYAGGSSRSKRDNGLARHLARIKDFING